MKLARERHDEIDLKDLISAIQEDGFAIVPNVLDDGEIDAVRMALAELLASGAFGRSDFEGFKTQRVYSLISKSRVFDRLVLDPLALAVSEYFLGHGFLLSAALAVNLGAGETAQNLHFDDAFYPLARPRPPVSISTMWMIDEFTADNGATQLCPTSHTWGTTDIDNKLETIQATGPTGSLLIYSGTLVHGGGANRTTRPRLGISIQYSAGWARPQENFILSLGLQGARKMPERLQELVGFSIYSLLMGQANGRHPRLLLDAGSSGSSDAAVGPAT